MRKGGLSGLTNGQSGQSGQSGLHTDTRSKFLEFLNDFIRTERLFVKIDSQDARIGIFRQVFDYFIQEFKTYSSILAQIKNEYETVISNLEYQVAQLEPLKGKLAISKLENLQELERQTAQMEKSMEKFKMENELLLDTYESIKKDYALQKDETSILLAENAQLKEKNIEFSNLSSNSREFTHKHKEELEKKDLEIEKLTESLKQGNLRIILN